MLQKIVQTIAFITKRENALLNLQLSRHPISQLLVSHSVDPQICICQTSGIFYLIPYSIHPVFWHRG